MNNNNEYDMSENENENEYEYEYEYDMSENENENENEFEYEYDMSENQTIIKPNETLPKEKLQFKTKNIIIKKQIDKTTINDKLEDNFEFNEETINLFSKGLDVKKLLIKHPLNSQILDKINDTKIICLLLKEGYFKDYHCNTPKCKVVKLWNGIPMQLILNRKNFVQTDLSISNLELLCGNCIMVTYGLDIFNKKKKETIIKCKECAFPLVKFYNNRKLKGICLRCEEKMIKYAEESNQIQYYNELNNISKTSYNNTQNTQNTQNTSTKPSTYKKHNYINTKETNTNQTKKVSNIILNTDVIDLSDLIKN